MNSTTRLGLIIFATLIGFSVLTLYTTLVQDVLFKGVSFCTASGLALISKVLALGTAGLVTGFLTSLLVLQKNYYPNVVLTALVIVKSLFFVGCERMIGPLWYDTTLTLTLLFGLWVGYFGGVKFPLSPA